jgi:hypothetical protein
MLNATQQIGASIGTAVLASLSVAAISSYTADALASGGDPREIGLEAQVEGYTTAFTWASGLLVIGALVSAFLVKATKEDLPAEDAVVHAG